MKFTQDFTTLFLGLHEQHDRLSRLYLDLYTLFGRIPTRFRRSVTVDVDEDGSTIAFIFTGDTRYFGVKEVTEILSEMVGWHSLSAVDFDGTYGYAKYTTEVITKNFTLHKFTWRSAFQGFLVTVSFGLENETIEGSIVAWEKPAELASKVLY